MRSETPRCHQRPAAQFARRPFSFRAFTLLEILVATALSSTVLLGVFTLLGGSLTLFSRTQQSIGQSADSRFALERIATDISGLVTKSGSVQFVENAPTLFNGAPPYSSSDQNEALFVVTPSLNSGAGDLCISAYRLNRDSLRIERAFIDSDTAWANSPKFLASGYPDLDWEPIAEHATAFEIRCYTAAEAKSDPLPESPENPSWDSETNGRPALATIRLSLIDEPTASRIREDGGLDSSTIPIPAPTTFTRTVTLQ